MSGEVRVVIVNWNSGRQLADCLRSLADHGSSVIAEVIVVDNGSSDGSDCVDVPDLPLRVERAGRNLGFAAACNIGARGADAPYLLFFNPDAMLRGDALQQAIAFLESGKGADYAVCGVQMRDEQGRIQHHTTGFPNAVTIFNNGLFANRFDHAESRPVDHVIGAFYLIRRSVFDELGGFDMRFFVYLEDLDLSKRVRERGWRIYYLANTAVFHKGGGVSEKVKAHRLFYAMRSRILYAFKHFGRSGGAWVAIGTLLIEPMVRLARAALRPSRHELADTLLGYRWLWADMPRILRLGVAPAPRGVRKTQS